MTDRAAEAHDPPYKLEADKPVEDAEAKYVIESLRLCYSGRCLERTAADLIERLSTRVAELTREREAVDMQGEPLEEANERLSKLVARLKTRAETAEARVEKLRTALKMIPLDVDQPYLWPKIKDAIRAALAALEE